MNGLLLLAQADKLDPTKIAEDLSQAQDVQQVLSTIVGVMVFVVIALVTFYLREKGAWGKEKEELLRQAAADQRGLLQRWSEAKIKWENERLRHAEAIKDLTASSATEKESLMREMLALALKIEKALTALGGKTP